MTRSSYSSIARVLAIIGAIVAIVGFVYSMVQFIISSPPMSELIKILWYVLGILISIFILIQAGMIKSRKINIPFNWWMLLIFVCLQAVMIALESIYISIAGLGLLLEIVAVILLLINVL